MINLKYQLRHGMTSLNYLMDHIFYQIFKNILTILAKNMRQLKHKTDNPSVRIYVNKLENRITFKIKTGYYLELLTPETMELLLYTKNKYDN